MAKLLRTRRTWLIALALSAATTGLIISLFVFAGSEQVRFTATLYSDVIRFEANGVASLRVAIYDLSENELWSSGHVMGDFVDWDRTNERGERLANGYYLYLVQGWDAAESLVLDKAGKVVLLPGDQVELKTAPVTDLSQADIDLPSLPTIQPMDLLETGVFFRVGIGTDTPNCRHHIYAAWPEFKLEDPGIGTAQMSFYSGGSLGGFFQYSGSTNLFRFGNYKPGGDVRLLAGGNNERMTITAAGNVGIGTASPDGPLDVESSSNQIYAGPSGTKGIIDVSPGYFDLHYGGNNFMGAYVGTPAATLYLDNNGGVHIGSWGSPAGGLEIRRDIGDNELVLNELTVGGLDRLWYECSVTDWVAGVDDGWGGGGYYIRDQTHGRSALDILGSSGLVQVHYGLAVWGGLNVWSGTKNFIMDHPEDPSKVIAYGALEGPEAGTYIRGSAELVGGEAVINLPDNFGMTTEPDGLTVQLTPTGEWLQLYVVEKTTATIVVREAQGKSGSFDYLVQGIRVGYADFEVVRDRDAAAEQTSVEGTVSGAGLSPKEEPLDPGLKHD